MNMQELADEIGKMTPDQLIELATIIAQKAKDPKPEPEPTILEKSRVSQTAMGE